MITAKPFKMKQLRAKRGSKTASESLTQRSFGTTSAQLLDEPLTVVEETKPEIVHTIKLREINREQLNKLAYYVVTNTGGVTKKSIDYLIQQFAERYGWDYNSRVRISLEHTLNLLLKGRKIEKLQIRGKNYYYNLSSSSFEGEEKDVKETNSASLNG